jgi:acyl-CoA thioesterase I
VLSGYGVISGLFNRAGFGLFGLIALLGVFWAGPSAAALQKAPPRELLVLALGDSLTAGYELPQTDSFPAQLQASLRQQGLRVRVHNAGVSGDTTTGGRKRMGWVIAALGAKPDLVILSLGANDALRGLDPKTTRANLDAMLADLKKRGIPVLLAGMLAPPNLGRAYATEFDRIFPDLAKTHSVPLYPFFLDGVAANPKLNLSDGIHPNKQGVAVIVARMQGAVRKALGR